MNLNPNRDYPDDPVVRAELTSKVKALGLNGHSHAQIAKNFHISLNTLEKWMAENAAFADAMAAADDFALAWWEALVQRQARTREGNASMIMFVMKNRFNKDYSKEALGEGSEPGMNTKPLVEMSPEDRAKLRAFLKSVEPKETAGPEKSDL